MQVILSRKGFDSKYGEQASPIMPDETLLSLPIPSKVDNLKFTDLSHNGLTYYEIIKQLNPKSKIKEKYTCHLDPDLRKESLQRQAGWLPLFGQTGAAQSHLKRQTVKEGDLFLFYGWFKKTEEKEGMLIYEKGARGLHIIYGYMQIGNAFQNNNFPDHVKYHPHAYRQIKDENNCIYEATEKLSFAPSINGAGCFKYHEGLVLTKKGGYTRGQWELPNFFRENKIAISYHPKNPYKRDYFQSASIGQEFVIEENDEITRWAEELVRKFSN